MACSKLEEIANATRPQMLGRNVYTEESQYSALHPNATQAVAPNDPNNIRGRGTGVPFDTSNGGTSVDINGIPTVYGSGRKAIYYVNQYNPDNQYQCIIGG